MKRRNLTIRVSVSDYSPGDAPDKSTVSLKLNGISDEDFAALGHSIDEMNGLLGIECKYSNKDKSVTIPFRATDNSVVENLVNRIEELGLIVTNKAKLPELIKQATVVSVTIPGSLAVGRAQLSTA